MRKNILGKMRGQDYKTCLKQGHRIDDADHYICLSLLLRSILFYIVYLDDSALLQCRIGLISEVMTGMISIVNPTCPCFSHFSAILSSFFSKKFLTMQMSSSDITFFINSNYILQQRNTHTGTCSDKHDGKGVYGAVHPKNIEFSYVFTFMRSLISLDSFPQGKWPKFCNTFTTENVKILQKCCKLHYHYFTIANSNFFFLCCK